MSSVYSERLISHEGLGNLFTWTVPSGKRAVVRAVDGVSFSGTDGAVDCRVAGVLICALRFQAPGESRHWDTRAVAYAGEVVQLATGGQDVAATVSGYVFADPTNGADRPRARRGAVVTPSRAPASSGDQGEGE